MPFSLPNVVYNPTGWGPPSKEIDSIGDLPYAPFSKSERFGRIADWFNVNQQRYNAQRGYYPNIGQNSFLSGILREEEEGGFQNVEANTRSIQRRPPMRFQYRPNRRLDPRAGFRNNRSRAVPQRQSKARIAARMDWQPRKQYVHRTASVDVRPTWKLVHQFAQADLAKLDSNPPEPPTDLKVCGTVDHFDTIYDKVNPRAFVNLVDCSSKTFHSVTTTEDPVIREMACEELPAGVKEHRVFVTDGILAALMSSTRSINPWDLAIDILDSEDSGKIIFFDKRDDFDLLPVSETSSDPPGSLETATALAEELALVNQRLSQQVLKKNVKRAAIPNCGQNPFAEKGEDVASALYKYRKWKLGENVSLVCRCQLDGAVKTPSGKLEFYKIFALIEYDARATEWRKKLETTAGAVLATEIKNNACTMAKWTARAMLGNADVLKIGYVTREKPSSRLDHALLQMTQHDPLIFARLNLSLNSRNMWAIVRSVVDNCLKLPEGKYVLLKDPNKPYLYLYGVPPDPSEEDQVISRPEENEPSEATLSSQKQEGAPESPKPE